MITCNGILGISILVGALRDHTTSFNAEGTASALATVATLAVLTLVLPTFTTSAPGPEFTSAQLAFAAVASVAIYACSCSSRPSATATTSWPTTRSTPRRRATATR